jgi:hypothetical protein
MNKTPALLLSLVFATLSYGADATPLSLKDFTDTNGEAPSAGWTEEADGTIHLKGKGGSLISKLECKSFELEWEWKVSDKGNNGIKYWVTKVANKEWLGIEYQMIDDNGHPDGLRGGSHTTASIYDIKAPVAEKGAKPAGEWNKSKIIVEEAKSSTGSTGCWPARQTPGPRSGRSGSPQASLNPRRVSPPGEAASCSPTTTMRPGSGIFR